VSDVQPMAPRVFVDWQRDGNFTGPYDDVTADVAAVPGFEIDGGRDGVRTLSPPKVQAGAFELFNHDGKYSQHRADSPVYQRVLPGRPVQYAGYVGDVDAYNAPTPYTEGDYYDSVATWQLGAHLIDAITQSVEWGGQRIALRTIGAEVLLTDGTASVSLLTNVRTDQCVIAVLDASGWPSSARSIALGDTTLSYFWADERRPWDALLELVAAEGGSATFYVDRDGVFHFENRNYRAITARSVTSQATYADHHEPDGLYFTSLEYSPGYDAVYNRATYATRRRSPGASTTVWEYGASLTVPAGETRELIARPSDPFVNVVAPVASVDYVVTTGSASVTLSSTSGFLAYINVTAGPSGCLIDGVTTNGLALRAQPLEVVSETVVENSLDMSASIEKYSPIPGAAIPIPLVVNGWPEIDPAMAVAVCDAWVNRYSEGQPTVTFQIRNVDVAHLDQIVRRTVSDRITVVEANTGLSDDAWVNMLRLHVSGLCGRTVELTLGCELAEPLLSGAVWDTAIWDDAEALWGI
jgi:hypothetical protein